MRIRALRPGHACRWACLLGALLLAGCGGGSVKARDGGLLPLPQGAGVGDASTTCVSGDVCQLPDDACGVGRIVCVRGAPACVRFEASPDGTPCDDHSACTRADVCIRGECVGQDAVICSPIDSCHDAGACNRQTGQCSTPVRPDGVTCDDGDQCTRIDTCRAGACLGTAPVECGPGDVCNEPGVCDRFTGLCLNPPRPDGTRCDDDNACTRQDICIGGSCTGVNEVFCGAQDQCHGPGTCDTMTGQCTNPQLADGTTCNDGNACTRRDFCNGGQCLGSNPVTCTTSDPCRAGGTCNPATGACSTVPAPDGTACNDNNACTTVDACRNGFCAGGTAVVCTASDQCHNAGVCSPTTGACSNPIRTNGSTCNDGNGCTRTDTCQNGTCTGANPRVCTASDQCHDIGTCTPATGLCSNPARTNGTACSDANACTRSDACQNGTCTGANPVVCTASDQCHNIGTCSPTTGACSNPIRTNGTACDDANACTSGERCQNGSCAAGTAVVCTASDQCHVAGTCSAAAGCSNPAAPDTTPCNDSDGCTAGDACTAGVCGGSAIGGCGLGQTCNATTPCASGWDCLMAVPTDATGFCARPCALDSTCTFAGPGTGRCVIATTTMTADHCGIVCGAGNTCPTSFTCATIQGLPICAPNQ